MLLADNMISQGNRVKGSCGDQVGEIGVVPCGGFEFQSYGVAARCSAGQVGGHVSEGCEVFRGLTCANSGFVVFEAHVHDPVEAVFDGPMRPCQGAEPVGGKRRRGDVEAPLPLDPAAGLAGGVDDKKGAQAGPGVALL